MDIQTLLEYLQKRGDIVAFATVDRTNNTQVDAALSIFGFVWTAITVRNANMTDFNTGKPWDYHPSSPVDGGHSVISGGHLDTPSNDVRFITWAAETGFTANFWAHDVVQTWIVILPEHFGSKEFMAGIDLPALAAAFQALTGRVLPIPGGNMNPSSTTALCDITAGGSTYDAPGGKQVGPNPNLAYVGMQYIGPENRSDGVPGAWVRLPIGWVWIGTNHVTNIRSTLPLPTDLYTQAQVEAFIVGEKKVMIEQAVAAIEAL
jgi:hypothetical protein